MQWPQTAYSPEQTRPKHLAAGMADLQMGYPVVAVSVPDVTALELLCQLYETAGLINHTATPDADPLLNQILVGPPGTGKTQAALERALELLAPECSQQDANTRN